MLNYHPLYFGNLGKAIFKVQLSVAPPNSKKQLICNIVLYFFFQKE